MAGDGKKQQDCKGISETVFYEATVMKGKIKQALVGKRLVKKLLKGNVKDKNKEVKQ